MAQCIRLQAVNNTANSQLLIVAYPKPPSGDLSTCPYVLQSGSELDSSGLLALTPAEGLQIGMGVGLLWALAWGFRMIGKTIEGVNSHVEND
jgi:hypothetical protein